MPQNRFDWHERIKAIEREYRSVRMAVDRLLEQAAHKPDVLGKGARPADLLSADENLQGTYLIRMFAEFETALRSYWATIKPNARIQAEALINNIGTKRSIPVSVINATHAARMWRNSLVHHRDEENSDMTIERARHQLATFLARLPITWGG